MGRYRTKTEWLEPHYARYLRFWFKTMKQGYRALGLQNSMMPDRFYCVMRGDLSTLDEVKAVREAMRKYASDNKLPELKEL